MAVTITITNGVFELIQGSEIWRTHINNITTYADATYFTIKLQDTSKSYYISEIRLLPTDVNGGIYTTVALLDEWIKSQQVNNSQGAGTGASLDAEYKSPIDFSTQRYSASQLTLSNLNVPIINSSQLRYIVTTNAAGTVTQSLSNGSNGVSLIWDATNSRIDVKKNGVAYSIFDMGTGLTLTLTVVSGVITNAVVVSGGTGYYVGATIAVTTATGTIVGVPSTGGANGTVVVATATGGVVQTVTVLAGGTGYGGGGSVTIIGASTTVSAYAIDVATVVGIDGQEKGYDSITNAFINFMNNYPVQPLHNVLIAPSTSVIADSWFPSKDGLDVGFHKRHIFTGILAPAASQVLTMTIEGTNADDLTVDANWTAIDFYNTVGLATVNTLATAAGTSTSFNIRIQDCGYRNIRYRITPSINTNANTCNCYLNSTY